MTDNEKKAKQKRKRGLMSNMRTHPKFMLSEKGKPQAKQFIRERRHGENFKHYKKRMKGLKALENMYVKGFRWFWQSTGKGGKGTYCEETVRKENFLSRKYQEHLRQQHGRAKA